MKTIILPNNGSGKPPVTMYVNDVSQICVSYDGTNTLNVGTPSNPTAFPVHVVSASDAAYQQQQIANALNSSSNTPSVIQSILPSWTGISPTTGALNSLYTGAVSADNLSNEFVNAAIYQFDDGGGHVFSAINAGYQGFQFQVQSVSITFAATYAFYFSLNGGSSWTQALDASNNPLTVVVS